MKIAHKPAVIGVAVVTLVVVIAVLFYGLQVAAIGTAYKAKILCSGIFVSQRDARSLLDTDLSADDLAPLRHIDAQVNRESREVTATFFGLAGRKVDSKKPPNSNRYQHSAYDILSYISNTVLFS